MRKSAEEDQTIACEWHINGLVQGVGFRPFVYRIARANGLKGWVENNNLGVTVFTEGSRQQMDAFRRDLFAQKPEAARIINLNVKECNIQGYTDFQIRKSHNYSDHITLVSPDIAVCSECLADLKRQPHRIDYPFINCTNCGPRFTIVRDLPYDRINTTMDAFEMCPVCRNEYQEINDRRFHAQPVSCRQCGPVYKVMNEDVATAEIPRAIAQWIDDGKIVALKGLGGFHFLCDAYQSEAVELLRQRKHRDGKPMAVMMPDLDSVKKRFFVYDDEEKVLTSWRRPIVLLKNKFPLAPAVSNGLVTTGIMLPYMPIHYQMFDFLKTDAIVFTSGNLSEEPVTIDETQGVDVLQQVADHVVFYNRDIHNRADDSVLMLAYGHERLIRRSRGYAPEPVLFHLDTEGIFAAGAELAGAFALGKGNMAILSQHIGDLKNAETYDFYSEAANRFRNLFRLKPSLAAIDLHPDYLSGNYARSLGIEIIEVQHHHAHIASCMAENGLDEKVIGIAFDGTGLGDDGSIWGSEFFLCDLSHYERKFSLLPVPLPGGDRVTEEPWRTAVSFLYQYMGKEFIALKLPFLETVSPEELQWVLLAIEKKMNAPLSSGAGRLFDAVAALTGLCVYSGFHAEAPMRLEAAILPDCKSKYLYDVVDGKIILRKLFYLIVKDLREGKPAGLIAAKFHNTMLALFVDLAKRMRKESGINKVVLSGGTFQNRYLLENSIQLLENLGFEVFSHRQVPSNDGGIALGQLAVAAALRREKQKNEEQTENNVNPFKR